jgi:hypothetical protein
VGDEREPAVVGLLATEGLPKELAEELAEDPPDELSERFPDVEWQVDVSAEPFSEPAPDSTELASALGTAAFSLASSNIWQLADGMTWPRLLGAAR